MKSRVFLILVALALVGGVGYRLAQARRAAKAPEERPAEGALIRTARVSRSEVVDRLDLTGTVRPRNEVDIFAKVAGRIETVHAQVGDRVKAGQTLATIEHKEISWQAKSAQAALKIARANLDGAKLELDRTEALFKGGASTQAQLDGVKVRYSLAEAQAAQAEAAAGLAHQQEANARVESPISGTITRRPVNVGNQVGPAQPLFTVQDVATLKVETSVDAAGFARLRKGAEARVTVDALPGQVFAGKVTLMSPTLDAGSRRAQVELEIDNSSGKLLPNMFARADLAVGRLPDALVVPRDAVAESAGGAQVFRVRDGKVQALRPRLGPVDGDKVAVLDGLAEGDEVAVSGVGGLADGAIVRVSKPRSETQAARGAEGN
jgi:RND family efflux transporter MFP subunit